MKQTIDTDFFSVDFEMLELCFTKTDVFNLSKSMINQSYNVEKNLIVSCDFFMNIDITQ